MVIFVVALIVLGPEKMPEALRRGGRLLGEAKQWSARISAELQSTVSSFTQEPPSSEPDQPTGGLDADVSDHRPKSATPPPHAGEPVPPQGVHPLSEGDSAERAAAPPATGPDAAVHLPGGFKEHRP